MIRITEQLENARGEITEDEMTLVWENQKRRWHLKWIFPDKEDYMKSG